LQLAEIKLFNYKNYRKLGLGFSSKISCFCGPNGEGKTNLLDAIYYLCFTKSYFNHLEQQNVSHDEGFFRMEGRFVGEEEMDVVVKFKVGSKKVIEANGSSYEKLSDHIGKIPAVIISPDDNKLILAGSEERRKFLDSTLAQFNSDFLNKLLAYNRALTQRNSLLKKMHEERRFQPELLEIYNEQLSNYAPPIFEARKSLIQALMPTFQKIYERISGGKEIVGIEYQSTLENQSMSEVLKENAQKDRIIQRTSNGVHRDELLFTMEGRPMKKFGSQGQQKSYLLALKLAQYQVIREYSGRLPLLLLDDLFDKLDKDRSKHLLNLLASDELGQVFITDTEAGRIKEAFEGAASSPEIFQIDELKLQA
jgi:DNA replication and repair protein RecF